ncbi:MAG TPA: transposase [Kiritimatiellia bacterium]|nr:transposase [Verrucomicrobiota bacterium]HRZ11707.1 transposase [Kiritimatiellia bacterium]HSA16742.1 transposase [Kiritimatiellia bacterium]
MPSPVAIACGIDSRVGKRWLSRSGCHAELSQDEFERIMREIRRRTRVVGCFPDGDSAMLLMAARLRHIVGTRWGKGKED